MATTRPDSLQLVHVQRDATYADDSDGVIMSEGSALSSIPKALIVTTVCPDRLHHHPGVGKMGTLSSNTPNGTFTFNSLSLYVQFYLTVTPRIVRQARKTDVAVMVNS